METIVPTEKARNYPGEISLWCGVVGFISGMTFVGYESRYHYSLFLDDPGILGGMSGLIWYFATLLGVLCWFISLFLILPVWQRKYRATGSIGGFLLPFLALGFVLPTQGLAHSTIYYRVSDPAAIQYLLELTLDKQRVDRVFLRENYEHDYHKPTSLKYQTADRTTETIIVEYKLRQGIKHVDLPEFFTVIIDRKTRKTTVLPGNETEENNVEK